MVNNFLLHTPHSKMPTFVNFLLNTPDPKMLTTNYTFNSYLFYQKDAEPI